MSGYALPSPPQTAELKEGARLFRIAGGDIQEQVEAFKVFRPAAIASRGCKELEELESKDKVLEGVASLYKNPNKRAYRSQIKVLLQYLMEVEAWEKVMRELPGTLYQDVKAMKEEEEKENERIQQQIEDKKSKQKQDEADRAARVGYGPTPVAPTRHIPAVSAPAAVDLTAQWDAKKGQPAQYKSDNTGIWYDCIVSGRNAEGGIDVKLHLGDAAGAGALKKCSKEKLATNLRETVQTGPSPPVPQDLTTQWAARAGQQAHYYSTRAGSWNPCQIKGRHADGGIEVLVNGVHSRQVKPEDLEKNLTM